MVGEGLPKNSLLVKSTLENAIRQHKPLSTITQIVEQYPALSNSVHDNALGKCSVFQLAVTNGYLALIHWLIEHKNADFKAKCNGGKTVLHLALELDDKESKVTKELLNSQEIKEIINEKNHVGRTALHTAVIANASVQVVELLIQNGADVNNVDNNEENVLHLCASFDRFELLEFFLLHLSTEQQLDPNDKFISPLDKDVRGYNALHCAAAVGELDICKLLVMSMLEKDPERNEMAKILSSESKDGLVPHLVAHKFEHLKCYEWLLEHHKIATGTTLVAQESKPITTIFSAPVSHLNTFSQYLVNKGKELSNSAKLGVRAGQFMDAPVDTITKFTTDSANYMCTMGKDLANQSQEYMKQVGLQYLPSTDSAKEQENLFAFVKNLGYPIEEHNATTDDGWTLKLFRITKGPNRPVVFLQHGLFNSGCTWLVTGPEQGLAFLLADAGFDVWMGNNRGVQFSRQHARLKEKDTKYWQWSWYNMAKSDLPAQLTKALTVSGAEHLTYIGHSQGTTQAFAGFSMNAEFASKVNLFVALAPVAKIKHQKSKMFKTMSLLKPENVLPLLGLGEIGATMVSRNLLPAVVQKFIGYDNFDLSSLTLDCDIDHEWLPTVSLYEPSPTSVYNLFHWAQASRTGRFEAYDYGRHENIVVYDQETPPEFNIAEINIPIALLYGDRDYLSTTDDVQFLLTGLPNVVYQEKVIGFRHNDFVWGKNACKTVYKTVIELLAKYNPTTEDALKVEEQIEHMPGEKAETIVEKDQLGIE